MSARLSKKQREFLKHIQACNEPVTIEVMEEKQSLPCYIPWVADSWNFLTESEARRWVENMESRRLITVDKGCFFRITDAGRAAIATTKQEKTNG